MNRVQLRRALGKYGSHQGHSDTKMTKLAIHIDRNQKFEGECQRRRLWTARLALALFVAPALLDAAFDTSPRDLRRNTIPVGTSPS